ncbi:hypothetical protein COO91_09239 (plasmid) [Nostoc flagelliforme CCNUN1]|uniref:Uncharacterized protein n=1 Tax=Nostoc flagelliforme CCNUN1 TaxID=2038116 RepID=A0A2K8T5Z1_9NOSO|nr:hypothetical protein COO91_09239 [Nostoc flagelliforme CCNUN1]
MESGRGAEERFVQVLSPLPLRTSAQELTTTQSLCGEALVVCQGNFAGFMVRKSSSFSPASPASPACLHPSKLG